MAERVKQTCAKVEAKLRLYTKPVVIVVNCELYICATANICDSRHSMVTSDILKFMALIKTVAGSTAADCPF